MLKLLRYLKKYWYFAILAPLFMIVEVGMDMLLTMYMSKMINYGVQTGNMDKIISYGLLMLLIVFIGVAGGILSGVFLQTLLVLISLMIYVRMYLKK
ncbi:MAG: hypothetical protein L6U99_01710 [Clostridium sp.]|nr:MAG: hypothetical protein L6U99_01710 [Clostridium sp.]